MNMKLILVAIVYSRIFQVCTPVSKYLQTNGMDILVALKMVRRTTKEFDSVRNEYDEMLKVGQTFASSVNSLLDDMNTAELGERIETELPQIPVKRIRKQKRLSSEKAEDDSQHLQQNPSRHFQVTVFNAILDTASSAARCRFEENDDLLRDISYLDPQNFSLCQTGIPEERMHAVADLAEINRENLCEELPAFSKDFGGIVQRENPEENSNNASKKLKKSRV